MTKLSSNSGLGIEKKTVQWGGYWQSVYSPQGLESEV